MASSTTPRANAAAFTYFDALTSLRGIGAIWVVVYHFHAVIQPLVVPTPGLLTSSHMWVDFFFLLSGFIICHVYGEQLTFATLRREVGPYILARFARIYPLHFFVLVLMAALWALASALSPGLGSSDMYQFMFDPTILPQQFALVHAHSTTAHFGWNVPSWSIAAEWWTYLTAPLLLPLLHGRGVARGWAAVVAGFVGLAVLERLHPSGRLDITYDYGWIRCLLGFIAGIGLYQLYRARTGARFLRSDSAFAVAALAMVSMFQYTPADVDALILVPLALLILSSAHNDGRVGRFLSTRPMRFLGDVSYSIYLLHCTVLVLTWSVLSLWFGRFDSIGGFGLSTTASILVTVAGVALSVALAALTYRYVEIPAREWLRRRAARSPAVQPS